MDSKQLSLFEDIADFGEVEVTNNITIVNATFRDSKKTNWQELFDGFDELYAITFSSGIQFMENVMEKFSYVEVIFGCEGVLNSEIESILAMEAKVLEKLTKSKSAVKIAERMDNGTLELLVSKDTKSHEKIFILRSKDGRNRVITGSANMSASAFCGYQREDIVCFDDADAFEYYMDRFSDFKIKCSNKVSPVTFSSMVEDPEFINDHIDEIPLFQEVKDKSCVILEQSDDGEIEELVVANVKGFESEIKPLLPQVKSKHKIIIDKEFVKKATKRYDDANVVKKETQKRLPKLNINYDANSITFNGKDMNLKPDANHIKADIKCFENYMESMSSFYGEWEQGQKDYYAFMNWYFVSAFMPYLRYIGQKNGYGVIPFPVFGIIYGESNGGKSTFLSLLSKMMCGVIVPANKSEDFSGREMNKLKCSCEGLPINIDDLAKSQYDNNYEKVIKDDGWGINEGFINYPAVAITTNTVTSLKQEVTKRVVACHIEMTLDKEIGAMNAKKINESIRNMTTSLYGEYARRMLTEIANMVAEMKNGDEEYFPDVFKVSSVILKSIFDEYDDEVPTYVRNLEYKDYFGNKAVGKNAINKIKDAWENDKKSFSIDRRKNKLIYSYKDSSRTFELKHIQQELPPVLKARVMSSSLIMELDSACEVFGIKFKKGLF